MKTAVLPLKPLFFSSFCIAYCMLWERGRRHSSRIYNFVRPPLLENYLKQKIPHSTKIKKHSADASTVDIKLYQIFTQILIAPEHSPSIGETLPGFRASTRHISG